MSGLCYIEGFGELNAGLAVDDDLADDICCCYIFLQYQIRQP